MAMVRNGYGTKMIFTMVRNGRYEMVMVRNDCNSPHLAVSITDRDCFWDGSVPNPLEVSVSSLTMSVSSNNPEPSGAGARVGGLADPVPSRSKVGIPTLSTVTTLYYIKQ
jgi:hypothetical protein